jgi:Putative prokaryotic signal transducing protein
MSNELITVATFADPIEANLVKNNLEAAGIRTYLANEESVDMLWHVGNAFGWIKVQVGNDDADAARVILGHNKSVMSTLDERVEDLPDATESLRVSSVDDEEQGGQDEDVEDEPEPTLSDREKNADRACRGAVVGLLFLPLQLYIFYLLLKIFVSREPLGDRGRRKALTAAVINLPLMIGLCFLLRAVLSSN